MNKPKGVTIKLTDKQRNQIKSVTGKDHAELRVESHETLGQPMAAKAALRVPAKAALRAPAKANLV